MYRATNNTVMVERQGRWVRHKVFDTPEEAADYAEQQNQKKDEDGAEGDGPDGESVIGQVYRLVGEMRAQIKAGGEVVLPLEFSGLMPPLPETGDAVLLMDWRRYSVMAVYDGIEWIVEIS